MSSKKEEERNEKIIRGLMKLPPNRRCFNCNSLGPQYVCTNFWTFVCIACSGIHREFTHRVKSVSMSKFTTQEVDALQRGGNQRAREQFLREWDTQRMRLPDNSNPDKIREFIKSVYVDKKYCGSRSSDKPPRDTQNLKGEEDYRRANSYHSFSQSPPYDHQYEERRYGKQAGMLTRKPGSDRGLYEGKLSSFLYSPGRQGEQICEDRFANESTGSRMSDYSVSSDPFRSDGQSPNFHAHGVVSPPSQVEDARALKMGAASELVAKEDIIRIPRAHRSASLGSFGSFDSNSHSLKSTNSGSLIDSVLEAAPVSATIATTIDLFNQEPVQSQNTSSTPSIDLFADFSQLPPPVPLNEQKPPAIPVTDNGGWATFEIPHHFEPTFQSTIPPSVTKEVPMENVDLFSSMHNNVDWFSIQNSDNHKQSLLVTDQWSIGLNEVKASANTGDMQLWNAFSDPIDSIPQTFPGHLPRYSQQQDMLHRQPTSIDSSFGFKASKVAFDDGFFNPAIDDKVPPVAALSGMDASLLLPSSIPQTEGKTLERKGTNPFDLPFDLEPEANNVFLDMSSLQSALPDPHLPSTFPDSLPDPWFQQSSLTDFIPPVPQGGLTCIRGQVPSTQLQNIPSQGSISSLGGNPFA